MDGRGAGLFLLLLVLIIVVPALVGGSWNPDTGFAIHGLILASQIMAFPGALDVIASALRQGARTGGEVGGDSSVGSNPVGERIFAVLDDGLGSLISVICSASLTRGDWSIIDQLQQVLSEASNDGELLAVFTESIELVGIGSLEFLASDVGQLSFRDKGLGFGTNKLLLENNDSGGVWLLVLQLSDLVGDLLLAYFT